MALLSLFMYLFRAFVAQSSARKDPRGTYKQSEQDSPYLQALKAKEAGQGA